MKPISLTQNKETKVDEEDFERLNQYKWCAQRIGKKFYAVSYTKQVNGFRRRIYMHRIILNAPEGKEVDHINNNGLDNTKANLRLCSRKENMWNKKCKQDNFTGFTGVYRHYKKFRAAITINGKAKHLGVFTTAKEAAEHYNKAAKKYHKEFASLNKINNH